MKDNNEGAGYETTNSKYVHILEAVTKSDGTCPDIKNVLRGLFEIGNPTHLVNSILEYLLENHKEATLKALRVKRLIPKHMNE